MEGNIKREVHYMSKNDDRILELKKQVEDKKKELASKKTRFVPITNCILEMDGMTLNLNVLSERALILLWIRLNTYRMSATDLGLRKFEISGYDLEDWITDVKARLEVIATKREENDLKAMETKLDKLLSEDKKTELELDSIAELLK